MSICSKCTQLKSISLCTDSLIIGTVADESAPYIVYFKSLATGAVYRYAVTSNANGILTLTFDAGFPLSTGTAYELWVNKAGDSIDDVESLTIGATTATCFTISANLIFDMYYEENVNFDSQTLEIA